MARLKGNLKLDIRTARRSIPVGPKLHTTKIQTGLDHMLFALSLKSPADSKGSWRIRSRKISWSKCCWNGLVENAMGN